MKLPPLLKRTLIIFLRWKSSIILLGIVAIALVLVGTVWDSIALGHDSILYFKLAEQVQSGKLYLTEPFNWSNLIQPGYAMLLSFVSGFGIDVKIAAKIVNLTAVAITVICGYFIGRKAAGEWAGYLAALALAVHPVLLLQSWFALTESVFIAFLLIVVWVGQYAVRPRASWTSHFLIGMLIGFLYLIRLVGLSMVLWYALMLLWTYIVYPNARSWRRYAVRVGMFAAGLCIFVLPYVAFLYTHTGQLTLTGQQSIGQGAIAVLDADAPDYEYEKREILQSLTADKTDYLINHPDEFRAAHNLELHSSSLSGTIVQGLRHLSNNLYIVVTYCNILLLGLLAPFVLRRGVSTSEKQMMGSLVTATICVGVIIFVVRIIPRYVAPTIPLLIILLSAIAMYGAVRLNRAWPRVIIFFLALCMICVQGVIASRVAQSAESIVTPYSLQTTSEAASLEWLDAHHTEIPRIISSSPYIPYQMHMGMYVVPDAPIADIITFACYNQIEYMMIHNNSPYYYQLGEEMLSYTELDDTLSLEWATHSTLLFRVDPAKCSWPSPPPIGL